MSSLKISVANFFAKNSCTAWQKSRPIRKTCRKIYRFIMETGATEYPYKNPEFAPWPEDDGKDTYCLVTDSDNFVIRRSPSFIAWKIKRTIGKWPKLPIPGPREEGEHAFDAKHWDEVLDYNGWVRQKRGPMDTGSFYIGILKDEGEFGQLVWLDRIETKVFFKLWIVSTYKDFKEIQYGIPSNNDLVIWYAKAKT